MNTHRDVIYKERAKILEGADLKSNILDIVREEITQLVELHVPERYREQWDLDTLLTDVNAIVKLPSSFNVSTFEELNHEEVLEHVLTHAEEAYERREEELGADTVRAIERLLMLRTIDALWVEHLTAMDEMRQGIGLRAYGQSDPLVAYKHEAHDMWEQLLANIRRQVTHSIYHVQLTQQRPAPARAPVARESRGAGAPTGDGAEAPAGAVATAAGLPPPTPQPVLAGRARKVGRNEPCPCGSGKKYKKCHGMAA